jgi:putative FmdB family regulatory protein
MALFDYKCSSCGNIEEKNHKISESPEYNCSKCNSSMQKIISSSSFHLKGDGWYSGGFKAKK